MIGSEVVRTKFSWGIFAFLCRVVTLRQLPVELYAHLCSKWHVACTLWADAVRRER